MAKSGEKLEKVGKSGKMWGKGGEKCGKWGKVTKSGEKLEKVGKSREKWGKVGKVGKRVFFLILDKMAADGHFGCPKITFDHSSCHFRSIRNFFFWKFLDKMAAGGHFGLDDNVSYRCTHINIRFVVG